MELPDRLKTYIEKKVSRLDRFMPIDEARAELALHETKSAGDRNVFQLTLRGSNGPVLRAEERSADMQTSIDAALEKMSRQIERYKGKHWRKFERTQTDQSQPVTPEEPEVEAESEIVRIKRFQSRPMDTEEAIEQMEMLGHDFFVFYNAADSTVNVVYRRRNGGYGLIIPELA